MSTDRIDRIHELAMAMAQEIEWIDVEPATSPNFRAIMDAILKEPEFTRLICHRLEHAFDILRRDPSLLVQGHEDFQEAAGVLQAAVKQAVIAVSPMSRQLLLSAQLAFKIRGVPCALVQAPAGVVPPSMKEQAEKIVKEF